MCEVIVIYAGRSRSTCHGRDAYIHDHAYVPRVYFPSYKFPIYFTLQSLLSIYIIKIPKIFTLSLLSLPDLTLVSDREGIDNPFIALVARFLFVCVGKRDLRVASY